MPETRLVSPLKTALGPNDDLMRSSEKSEMSGEIFFSLLPYLALTLVRR